MAEEKKPKKKISMSKKLQNMKEDRDYWKNMEHDRWKMWRKAETILQELEKILPRYYFKLKYSCDAKGGGRNNNEEIVFTHTPRLALMYFEEKYVNVKLIDIEKLA